MKRRRITYKAKKRGGSSNSTIASTCQCMNNGSQTPCPYAAEHNSLFCKHHTHCKPAPTNGYEPAYDPDQWNKNPFVRLSHNCYSFARHKIIKNHVNLCKEQKGKGCRQYFPVPGSLSGNRYKLLTCKEVEKGLKTDIPGLEKVGFYDTCPVNKSKIAMAVDKGNDFHFWLQNKNCWKKVAGKYANDSNIETCWTHKPGSNHVIAHDANNKPIFNPQTASRNYTKDDASNLNYKDFCGFYCVPRDHGLFSEQYDASFLENQKQLLASLQMSQEAGRRRGGHQTRRSRRFGMPF